MIENPEEGDKPRTPKVLLINDDAVARSLLRNMLRMAGYQHIRDAAEAKAGILLAKHFAPDVICLDIQMPGKSGLEVLDELKACVPTTPVLMVTASNDADTVEACLKGRADGYVIKPFSAGTLLKTIERALAKSARSQADRSMPKAGPAQAPGADGLDQAFPGIQRLSTSGGFAPSGELKAAAIAAVTRPKAAAEPSQR